MHFELILPIIMNSVNVFRGILMLHFALYVFDFFSGTQQNKLLLFN